MTDDTLDERLAGLESAESSSLEKSADPNDDSAAITLGTRFWAAFVLAGQVRILLSIVPVISISPTGRVLLLASLIGGVAVAEYVLRRFGPAIVSALWDGSFAALLVVIAMFFASMIVTGSSLPDSVNGIGFLVVSATVTAHRFD